MVVRRKKKKFRKFRGKRTYGYGTHKKHRGGGSRGGRGKAGGHKHKWSYVVKYEPERFGKRGFKRPAAVKRKIRAININELVKIAEREGKMKINLTELGYDKLLGTGKITQPLTVEVASFSKIAAQKLEKAGGKIIKIERAAKGEKAVKGER